MSTEAEAPKDRIGELTAKFNNDSYVTQHVNSSIALLVTAIGGPDHTSPLDPPPYKLGDDALACLKDLKRWLKLVDDAQKRWDVAAAMSTTNLMDDLLNILCDWKPKSSMEGDKIALLCLELMFALTWPLQLVEESSNNQAKHYTFLKQSQLNYKKQIISFKDGKVLKNIAKLAVPVVQMSRIERTSRDNSILKCVLLFFRNLLAIEPELATPAAAMKKTTSTSDPEPVSLSEVVTVFNKNKIFTFLLTMANSLNEYDGISLPLLEIIYYLTKNVKHGETSVQDSLGNLLEKEQQLKKQLVVSSRHSRFGTLLSLQTDKQRLTVSSVQHNPLDSLDARKKWRKRILRTTASGQHYDESKVEHLSNDTRKIFDSFIDEFNFNQLIRDITRSFAGEDVANINKIQFMLTISWFLKRPIEKESQQVVLMETTLVTIFNYLGAAFETRSWDVCHSALVVVADCIENEIVDDNMLASKLHFIWKITRVAYRHNPQFISSVIHLVHVITAMNPRHISRFTQLGSIQTFITYLKRYEELSDSEIKKVLQLLHRVGKEHLFRMDFILLLKQMLSTIPQSSRVKKHVESFGQYFILKLREAFHKNPSLYIEILFPHEARIIHQVVPPSNNHESDDEYDENGKGVAQFDELEEMERRLEGKEITKGTATKKKLKLPSERAKKTTQKLVKMNFVSDEFIDDSDEDDDRDQIFFENESLLRRLLENNGGQLSEEQMKEFVKLAQERMRNNDINIEENGIIKDALVARNNDEDVGISQSFDPLQVQNSISRPVTFSDDEMQSEGGEPDLSEDEDILSDDEYRKENVATTATLSGDEEEEPVRKRQRIFISDDED